MKFRDRMEAGRLLAEKLRAYKLKDAVVLAVPRGGVPVAKMISVELGCPLDLVMVKKIGHPLHPEYAVGAVSLTDRLVIPHAEVSQKYIDEKTVTIRQQLWDAYEKFRQGFEPVDLKGKAVVVVVDDGIATGNTLLAAVQMLRKQHPSQIIVAAPVSSASAYYKLSQAADVVITLHVPDHFTGVGAYYEHFDQLTDEDVINCLTPV